MKRVSFAWVTKVIDFDNENQAIDYVRKNFSGKNWNFKKYADYDYSEYEKLLECQLEALKKYRENKNERDYERYCDIKRITEKIEYGQYVNHYQINDGNMEEYWSVEVQMPYGKYNTGW